MERQDKNEVSNDGKEAPETPYNAPQAAEIDGPGKPLIFVLPLNHDAVLTEMMKLREEDKQYINYLEREAARLNHIIIYHKRTIAKLLGKRAELYAANKILHENGLLT